MNSTKAFGLLICAALTGALMVSFLVSSAPQQPGEGASPLRDKVTSLEARVADLESRLDGLDMKLQSYRGRIPPGAVEREINGMKFYIIPVDEFQKYEGP
ncbi:MAG TPA: hypothetical protein VMY18_10200 [Acidobacteriota bacterium]|nr:hypothetical protein [Acidobacteriota bacterium]